MNVRPFFVAQAQSPELIEPCEALRRTNRIPVRQARSRKRGLPPLGLRGTHGNIG